MKTDEVVWGRLNLGRAVHLLHNPRYAGAFSYGRRHSRRQPNDRPRTTNVPRDQWHVLLLDAHPGYLSWEDYERVHQQLRASALAFGLERRHAPPREGPALLQGLALCGRCGVRMAVRYHERRGWLVPDYVCHIRTLQYRDPACQVIPGGDVDAAMGHLLVDTMTPMTMELTLAVQAELEVRREETDRVRHHQLERALYEMDRARQRYMQVDPTNRLVAATLEATWNERLQSVEDLRARLDSERAADRATFDEAAQQRIRALAANFPAVWHHPATPERERKRMMALLVTDVTLTKAGEQITMGVRFRGGATTTVSVPAPLTPWRKRQTHPRALARAKDLLETHTHAHVEQLNAEGFITGAGAPFDAAAIGWLARRWGLKTYRRHLQAAGNGHRARRAGLRGLAPTFYLRGYVALPEGVTVPLSPLKIVHGVIATAWLCLFGAQTLLVATARVSTHRRLGLLGAPLAVGMVAVGIVMTIDALRRGVDPVRVDPRVWWLGNTLPPIVLFAVFVTAALAVRRRVHAHKRLMLLATINLAAPALGRVALFNLDASLVTPFAIGTLLALVLVPIVYSPLR